MTVQYHEDQPEQHYTYDVQAADPDSEIPYTLDGEDVQGETPTPVSTSPGGSLADMLREEVGRRTTPTFTMRVPGRPGWSMKFRLDWTEAQSAKWEKAAQDRTRENGLNVSKLWRQSIADQCIALLKDGQPVPGYGDFPFKSQALQKDFGVPSATAAVEKWLPIFSTQLTPVAQELAKAARQESLLDPTDPD